MYSHASYSFFPGITAKNDYASYKKSSTFYTSPVFQVQFPGITTKYPKLAKNLKYIFGSKLLEFCTVFRKVTKI